MILGADTVLNIEQLFDSNNFGIVKEEAQFIPFTLNALCQNAFRTEQHTKSKNSSNMMVAVS